MPELKGVCGRSLVLYQYDWSGIEDIPRPEIPAGANEEEARRLNDEYQEQVAQVTGSHRVYLLDVDTGAEQELAGWTSRQGSSGRAILWQDDTLSGLPTRIPVISAGRPPRARPGRPPSGGRTRCRWGRAGM